MTILESIKRTLENESCQYCSRRKGRGTQLMKCASYSACLEDTISRVLVRMERFKIDLYHDLCDERIEETLALTEKLGRGEGMDDYKVMLETINQRYDDAIQAIQL